MKILLKILYWLSREAELIRDYNSYDPDSRYAPAALLKDGELTHVIETPKVFGGDWVVEYIFKKGTVRVKTNQIREIGPKRHYYGYE